MWLWFVVAGACLGGAAASFLASSDLKPHDKLRSERWTLRGVGLVVLAVILLVVATGYGSDEECQRDSPGAEC